MKRIILSLLLIVLAIFGFFYFIIKNDCYNYVPTDSEKTLIQQIESNNDDISDLKINECFPGYWEVYFALDSTKVSDSISFKIFEQIEIGNPNKKFKLRVFCKGEFKYLLGRYKNEIEKRSYYCIEC